MTTITEGELQRLYDRIDRLRGLLASVRGGEIDMTAPNGVKMTMDAQLVIAGYLAGDDR